MLNKTGAGMQHPVRSHWMLHCWWLFSIMHKNVMPLQLNQHGRRHKAPPQPCALTTSVIKIKRNQTYCTYKAAVPKGPAFSV